MALDGSAPPLLTRRRLIALLATTSPMLVAQRRRSFQAAGRLDQGTLTALAEAVLPMEIGATGVAAAVQGFQRWLQGYRGGAELLHGYGASEIRYLPPSPASRFEADLKALERRARAADNTVFGQLSRDDRQRIVEEMLAKHTVATLPSVVEAPHVAIALVAHWTSSSAGYNAAYRARINRFNCRPLSANPHRPQSTGEDQ